MIGGGAGRRGERGSRREENEGRTRRMKRERARRMKRERGGWKGNENEDERETSTGLTYA